MAFTEADVQTQLKTLIDPNTGRDFVSGKSIRKVQVTGDDVALDVVDGQAFIHELVHCNGFERRRTIKGKCIFQNYLVRSLKELQSSFITNGIVR